MLLLELTRRALHQVFGCVFGDWLRISLIGLVSVVLVFLIAQWTALLSVVLTFNRAHLTETDAEDHSAPEAGNQRHRMDLGQAPPMYGTLETVFPDSAVWDDLWGWDLRRSAPSEPAHLPPGSDIQARLVASGLSLVDFNILTKSTRLTWRPNPYPPGMLATRCSCGTTSWWRWTKFKGIDTTRGGHDPPHLIIDKPSGVP